MVQIVISSGHGLKVRGASGYLDEVDEARLVVEQVADMLRSADVGVKTFHDDVSTSQSENLDRIVDFHNSQTRDLDISVHFNAYETTSGPMGTECLYVSQQELAADVALAISAASGLKNRGPKKRTDLAFLNNTDGPAILIETCFCDSRADADIYGEQFAPICQAIAEAVSGETIDAPPPGPQPPQPPPDGDGHPLLGLGSQGAAVEEVQRILGLPIDGDFGPVTEAAVKGYQRAYGAAADGIVGPDTWDALDELDQSKKAGNDGLPTEMILAITEAAENSQIAQYAWRDRGKAPAGYTAGVALAFALALSWAAEGDAGVQAMGQEDRDDPDTDALSWYRGAFEQLGMDNDTDGADTLRHLFALILGLGPRESSGRYCEGRDMSASNASSDTAEASLFQTSWNISTASGYIPPLLYDYWGNPNGFLPEFSKGVSPSGSELDNFGTGDGARYQFLSKYAPAFHVMVTALGLRYRRQHWGPINRREAELRQEADAMLLQVQDIVEAGGGVLPPEPPITVITITINIVPPGSVRVIITGGAL